MAQQSSLFRGIYEFEDPSGVVLGAKVPATGTVDLYDGTAVIVKPSQAAVFIYKGKVADVLYSGTTQLNTGNLPLLSKLAGWKFGFESPLKAELVFVSGHEFTGRRWGTPQPIIAQIAEMGSVALRAHGTFNLVVSDPSRFFLKLMGTRSLYAITDLEDFVQSMLVSRLPEVFTGLKSLVDLSPRYEEFSKNLEALMNDALHDYGIGVESIQMQSVLPSKEVLEALDAKTAMQVIGSQKNYLVYKAANSLSAGGGDGDTGAGANSMQMLMSLMLSKGLLANEIAAEPERVAARACPACHAAVADAGARFCPQCGRKLA